MEIVKSRYATKKFNGKIVPESKMQELYEMIRLSASSYGIQPWKIKVVTDAATKKALTPASYNQAQIESCSHLLVFCTDTNLKGLLVEFREMLVKGNVPSEVIETMIKMIEGGSNSMTEEQQNAWLSKQVYLAAANAINGAKALGLDSCPMEGFNASEYSKILKLPKHLQPTLVIPVGYAADTARPKLRYAKDKIFI